LSLGGLGGRRASSWDSGGKGILGGHLHVRWLPFHTALECHGALILVYVGSLSDKVPCSPPGIGAKIQGNFWENKSGITYITVVRVIDFVAFKSAVRNLEIAISDTNSTALEVACSPPGISENFNEFSRNIIVTTYSAGNVALECAVINL
jgi:hypothetical protein